MKSKQSHLTKASSLLQSQTLRSSSLSIAALAAVLLTGCATPGPDHSPLKPIDTQKIGLLNQHSTEMSDQWWQAWGDDALNQLILAALKDRPTLLTAKARLYKAVSLSQLSQSLELPQFGLGADLHRQSYSTNGLFGGLLQGTGLQTTTTSTLQTGINWNIDLWGMHAAQTAAAIGEAKAIEADTATAALLTATEVAKGYISLSKLGTQLEVAERGMRQREEIYDLTLSRLSVGLDTKVEVSQAKSAYYEARVQREFVLEQMDLLRHQLAALTAQPMNALDKLTPRLEQLKFTEIPSVVGADLLGRRPDIVAAKLRIEAATQGVRAADKQFYPNINLNAYAGYNALKSNPLINAKSKTFDVDPAISLPIFDAGRLRAQLGSRRAELDEAIANYNETVIQAARESSDMITSTQSVMRQIKEQQEAVASAKTAYELSLERYKAGLGNYLIVLNTESQWLNQQRLSVELQARQFETRLALIKTLGGGYSYSPGSNVGAKGGLTKAAQQIKGEDTKTAVSSPNKTLDSAVEKVGSQDADTPLQAQIQTESLPPSADQEGPDQKGSYQKGSYQKGSSQDFQNTHTKLLEEGSPQNITSLESTRLIQTIASE